MKHLLYLLFVVFSFVACTPNQMSDKTVGGEDSIKTSVEKTVEKSEPLVIEPNSRDSLWNVSHESYFNLLDLALQQGSVKGLCIIELSKLLGIEDEPYVYGAIHKHVKVGDYHLLYFQYGEECADDMHCSIVNDNYDVVDKLDITGGCIHSFTENDVNEADIQTYDKYIYFMSGGEYGLRCSADSVYKESKILFIVKDTISNVYYGSEFYSCSNYSVDSTGHFVVGNEINDAFNVDSMINRMRAWPFNDK